jgi:hypothetical protein
MARRRTATGVAALLACLVALAACERYPAPSPASEVPTTVAETTSTGTTVATSTAEPPSTSSDPGPTGGGNGGSGGTGGKGNGGSGDNGSGDNGSGDNGGAAGSPIDVPTIPDPHTSMEGLRPAIEGAFVAACGDDTLCVHLVYTHGECLLGYDPSHRAARGSTVKVLTESQKECDAANGVTTEPTDEPTTGTDGTTSVATDQPAPDAT